MIIKFDDELKDNLDTLISGMLPHENYDSLLFMDIHENILRYVKEDEMPLEYKILFNIIGDVIKINISTSKFNPIISRDSVDIVLSNSLMRFISTDGYKYKEWFENRGIVPNFEVMTSVELASSKVYEEVMNVYDRCYEKKINSNEALTNLVAFKSAFLECVTITITQLQVEIIQGSLKYNRKFYKGPEGWISFMNMTLAELNNRMNDELHSESNHLNSLEKAITYLEKARAMAVPISSYGIPPLDNTIPLVSNRLTVICADEGIGKTQFCTYLANNTIRDSRKVLYMFGESDASELFTIVLRNFIYKKFQRFVTVDDIKYPENASEDVQKLINLGVTELYKTGCYIDRQAYTYENLYEELVADYEKYHMDLVIIDHSASLNSTGELKTEKERIDALAIAVRNFKRDFPCQVIVTSHLSVEGRMELVKHGKIYHASPTRGSGNLSKEADDVFVLTVTEKLEKQSLRGLHVTKRRGASKHSIGSIVLKVLYNCGEWVYDKRLQNEEYNSVEVDAAVKNLEAFYEEDGEEEIEIIL